MKAHILDGLIGIGLMMFVITLVLILGSSVVGNVQQQLNVSTNHIAIPETVEGNVIIGANSTGGGGNQKIIQNQNITTATIQNVTNVTGQIEQLTSFLPIVVLLMVVLTVLAGILSILGGWGHGDTFTEGLRHETRNMQEAVKYIEKKVEKELEPKKEEQPKPNMKLPKKLKSSEVDERYDLELYDDENNG